AGLIFFVTRLELLRHFVLGFHLQLMRFEIVQLQVDRTGEVVAAICGSFNGPGFFGQANFLVVQFDRLHHLPNEAVGHDDDGVAIAVSEIERKNRQVRHLLHGCRREYDVPIVAVAAAFYKTEVVALFRRNVPESRPGANNVDNHAGKLRAREVGNAFLHQAEAGARGCGHDAGPGRSCAVHHVDGGDFAFRLQERSADLWQIQSCRFGDLAGGGNGISVVLATAGQDGSLYDGDVTFTELPHALLLGLPTLSWAASAGRLR